MPISLCFREAKQIYYGMRWYWFLINVYPKHTYSQNRTESSSRFYYNSWYASVHERSRLLYHLDTLGPVPKVDYSINWSMVTNLNRENSLKLKSHYLISKCMFYHHKLWRNIMVFGMAPFQPYSCVKQKYTNVLVHRIINFRRIFIVFNTRLHLIALLARSSDWIIRGRNSRSLDHIDPNSR